ncbi:MAG: GNAT family N-acetyltransferase [Chloroflexi bacterium]|nr:GNAT family N-acetyltransferase [Chloroflexota bacterium]
MSVVHRLTTRGEIRPWLERERPWAIYALGDLEDGMFELCEWYAARDALVLIFKGLGFVPLVTIGGADGIADVLAEAIRLPGVYLNQRDEHLAAVQAFYDCAEPHRMLRMALDDFRPAPPPADGSRIVRLGMGRLAELNALYAASNAGDAFAPYQLATGYFHAVELDGQMVSVAGVHLASRAYAAGPVGNVATLPVYRGRGYAAAATTAVVRALQNDGITTIGLNVETTNTTAIRVYERLGFVRYCEFTEGAGVRRGPSAPQASA